MYGTEHIHGYRSADEADIVFITVNQRDQVLYASARVRKNATRLRVELSQFENPDGEYVQDHALSRRVQRCIRDNWRMLPPSARGTAHRADD